MTVLASVVLIVIVVLLVNLGGEWLLANTMINGSGVRIGKYVFGFVCCFLIGGLIWQK